MAARFLVRYGVRVSELEGMSLAEVLDVVEFEIEESSRGS